MFRIMEKDVALIVEKLVNYKNSKKLSWSGAYSDVLDSLGMKDRDGEIELLRGVVKKISRDGYDIMDEPFRLKRYR